MEYSPTVSRSRLYEYFAVLPCGGAEEFGEASNVVIFPYHRISGRVIQEVGTGLQGVTATLELLGLTTVTDEEGNYEFSRLLNGEYLLTRSRADWSFEPPSVAITIQEASVAGNNFDATYTGVRGRGDW